MPSTGSKSKSKTKSKSSASSSLVTLATLWMTTVTADAARGAWGSSHSGLAMRRHHYDEDPLTELVRDSFYMPTYPNSLLRQQHGGSYFERKGGGEEKPHFDITEGEDGTTELTMELPGLSARDLNIELENDHLLRVSGVRTRHKNGYISRTEFNEAIRLKDNVDVDKIQSHLSSGILTITIPEKAKKIKKLPVQSDEKSILDPPVNSKKDDEIV